MVGESASASAERGKFLKDACIHMALPAWEATVRSSTCTQGSGRLNQVASLRQTMEANHEGLIPGPVLCDWSIKSLFLPGLNASLSMSIPRFLPGLCSTFPFPSVARHCFLPPSLPLQLTQDPAKACHQRQHQPITDCRHRSAPQCPCRLSYWRTFCNSEPGLPETQSCRDQQ